MTRVGPELPDGFPFQVHQRFRRRRERLRREAADARPALVQAVKVVGRARGGHVLELVPTAAGTVDDVMHVHRGPAAARHLAEAAVAREDLLLESAALGQRVFPGLDEVFRHLLQRLAGREPAARHLPRRAQGEGEQDGDAPRETQVELSPRAAPSPGPCARPSPAARGRSRRAPSSRAGAAGLRRRVRTALPPW